MSSVRKVAFLPPAIPISLVAPGKALTAVEGPHACRDSHMVVLDTFGRLHQPVAGEDWVVHALYIIGLGKPVTTFDEWARIGGNVMSKEAARITVFHEPLYKTKVSFVVARSIANKHPDVMAAFRAIAHTPGAGWVVTEKTPSKPTAKTEMIHDLQGLWEWLRARRKVQKVSGRARVWVGARCA